MLLPASFPPDRTVAAENLQDPLAGETAARRRAGRLRPPAGGRVRHDDAGAALALYDHGLAAAGPGRQQLSRSRRFERRRTQKIWRRLLMVLPPAAIEARQDAGDEIAGECGAAEAADEALSEGALHLSGAQPARRFPLHGEALARSL